MKTYKHVLFDLDGTLADPSEGITKCIAYALQHFGIQIDDLKTLESWIGPPIKDSLRAIYNFDDGQAELAVQKYRERFATKGIYENKLFDEVPELLSKLKRNNFSIYLATSKPEPYAEQIVKHFGISEYFDFVGGAAMDDSRPTKAHVIERVLQQTNLVDLSRALMIGDRKYDIIGGQTFDIDTAGILHGFGSETELKQAGATYVFADLNALTDFLITQ